MNRTASLLALAAVLGAVAVALGAWAAHGLEAAYGARAVSLVETAVRYQLWHALAIMATLGLHRIAGQRVAALVRAAQLFALGMILFCGALYILAFGGPRWLGAVAPIGGLGMITGWLMLAWGAVKAFREPQSRG
ncbi:DUF423 domain-containing protein [Vineibacter terrae]|uniref:DUF423 domain-containing protein n=1 Tax=Vineibacter terrae TaxID=2586908 RepID=UPI002E371F46|nr:DUF423 domain-containing protein [Vineibacter terrae]HEX2890550.1 DUF423 domain-containing protein [Vineibacter terrae]